MNWNIKNNTYAYHSNSIFVLSTIHCILENLNKHPDRDDNSNTDSLCMPLSKHKYKKWKWYMVPRINLLRMSRSCIDSRQ